MCVFKPHKKIHYIHQSIRIERCMGKNHRKVQWKSQIKVTQRRIRSTKSIFSNVFFVVLYRHVFLDFLLMVHLDREYVLQIAREHSVSKFVAESDAINEWMMGSSSNAANIDKHHHQPAIATSFQMTKTHLRISYRSAEGFLSMKRAFTLHVQLDKSRRRKRNKNMCTDQCERNEDVAEEDGMRETKHRAHPYNQNEWMENVNVTDAVTVAATDGTINKCSIKSKDKILELF